MMDLALTEARASYYKDILYRGWASGHGGIYVPITAETPVNPHLLNVAERDVTTPSGRRLTLVNPAYMTRQVFELRKKGYGIQGHITSLNPVRPENSADSWERIALNSFEHGTEEVIDLANINGKEYLRLMRPMVIDESCLKCHGHQNYKVGDIRGGLSVSVPMKPYRDIGDKYFFSQVMVHLFIMLLGLVGVYSAFTGLGRMDRRRVSTQRALEDSEAHLRTVFDAAANVAFVSTDQEGDRSRVMSCSAGAIEIFGYSAREFVGKEVSQLCSDEYKSLFLEQWKSLCETGRGFSGETMLRKKSGEEFPALLTVHPRHDVSGKMVGAVVVAVDISERRKHEEALRQSDETARALLDANTESAFLLDLDGSLIILNTITATRLGRTVEELLGKCIFDYIPQEVVEARKKIVKRVIETGVATRYSFEHEGLILDQNVCPLFDSAGKVNRIAVFAQDVTAKRQAEDIQKKDLGLNRAIAEISKELLSETYNIESVAGATLKAVLAITDSKHGFVSSIDKETLNGIANASTEMFGADSPAKGENIVCPVGDDGKYLGIWGSALNEKMPVFTNTPAHQPNYIGMADGYGPPHNYMVVPVLIGDNLFGLIALANSNRGYYPRDVVAVERIAEVFALAIHRQDFETERIEMDKRLRQLQKNEAIGSLAGGIAHDFNNILTPIIGHSEFLKHDLAKDSSMRESVQQILLAAARAKDLVKQILTFSRQQEQDVVSLKPHLVIKEVVKLITSTLPATILIKRYIDEDCRNIKADPSQIHQVAMNLLTNAYHSMEDSGGVLVVSLQNMDFSTYNAELSIGPGSYVVFTVEDTGCGIEKDALDKLFNPYYSTKPLEKGTGLGLSVVYGIVKNYKGEIEVDSTPGEGTRFRVYFPAFEQEVVTDPRLAELVKLEGSENILMLDDDPAVLETGCRLLMRYGYNIEMMDNSKEVLEEIVAHPGKYDLLITDMTMPGMTGDTLTQEIRKVDSKLSILICTGFSQSMTSQRAVEIGADGLLMKPVGGAQMAGAVREILDRGRGESS